MLVPETENYKGLHPDGEEDCWSCVVPRNHQGTGQAGFEGSLFSSSADYHCTYGCEGPPYSIVKGLKPCLRCWSFRRPARGTLAVPAVLSDSRPAVVKGNDLLGTVYGIQNTGYRGAVLSCSVNLSGPLVSDEEEETGI